MNAGRVDDNTTAELQSINRALAALLGTTPLTLTQGANESLADSLVICGILGGKDVGKSTLINALAKRSVSTDAEEVGAGTSRPMAYVHRDAAETARTRFRGGHELGEIDVTLHEAAAIRNAVLVDLPDFDSEFPQHLEIVRHIAPRLDRVIWVVTARKMADRAWVAFCREVVKDVRNVHFVVNKADELVADEVCWNESRTGDGNDPRARAEAFWQAQQQWAAQGLASTGSAVAADGRFLVAARYSDADAFVARVSEAWGDPTWERYAADRAAVSEVARLAGDEIQRLRSTVLRPVEAGDADALKQANRAAEVHANVARIRAHYDLARHAERLQHACEPAYVQGVLSEAFGPSYCEAAAAVVACDRAAETTLAGEVMDVRVERWPILRAVYWPLRWLVHRTGRTLVTASPGPTSDAKTLTEVAGRTTADRVATATSRIRQDHAAIVRAFRLEDAFAEPSGLASRLEARLTAIGPGLDRQTVADVLAATRGPGFVRRGLVWLALLWFPFVQPVTEGMLQIVGAEGGLNLLGGLYKVVWALGAGQLLKGFAVVAAIYLACLAAMVARCVRDVRRTRAGEADGTAQVGEAVEAALTDEVALPISQPFVSTAATLGSLAARLDGLGGNRT